MAAYALWSLTDGFRSASIILVKVKLALMLLIGDSYWNELCLAVFAARLKSWIQDQTSLTFAEHVPFLDSRIVQAMMRWQSYGFNLTSHWTQASWPQRLSCPAAAAALRLV